MISRISAVCIRIFAVGAALATAIAPSTIQAQGDLLVAPTRVILDGRRGAEIVLSNIGSQEATYRIGLELRRMEPNGQLKDVPLDEANEVERAALAMVRYAPRRITLPPGQPQAVRVSARPGADLPDGEYRVHLAFRAIPKPQPATQPGEAAQGVTIKLIPIYGVTIPVIVRHGKVEAQVALGQPRIESVGDGYELVIDMQRQGNSSTYGELSVTRAGDSEPVVLLRGVAIYPEVEQRELRVPLTSEQANALMGPVRVEYREMPELGGGLIASIDAAVQR